MTVMLMLALAASSAAAKPAVQIVRMQLSGADLNVTLSCAAGPCKGSLLLAKVSAGKQSPKAVLAKRTYAIPAHHQKTVTAKLTARGRTLSDIATNGISITVMLVVGVIIGFGFESPFLHVVAGILLLLLFGYAFSWVFAFIGLTSSSPEAAQSLGFILIFPLTFVSSAFVPPETMPGALRWFAEWNPFSITVNAIRALFIGDPAGNSVWGAVAWSVGIAALFAFLAVTKYKRAVVR